MAPKKSIFRQPGARHFQLVHRSQRDPLIHDPDASQHVLKPFERENAKKGKNRIELESILPPEEVEHDRQARVGEAALYGIYYDDTQYDYIQHLRPVGVQEDGVESTLIEAPSQKKKGKAPLDLQLPRTVFASSAELPRNYESEQAIPESIAGFKPDMDPHLRQALEALDDDAFVDDDLDDDFFVELVEDGERQGDEDPGFEFKEGLDKGGNDYGEQFGSAPGNDAPWEERFAFFKKVQGEGMARQSNDEFASEAGDTLDGLPTISVIGGKKRRRNGSSQASGYSMSSSSMHRNEALQTLDDRFDQLMLKEYNEEIISGGDSSDDAPELITARDDFEAMMNEFMTGYEILGKKLQPKLPGETGPDKLDVLRRAMGQDDRTSKVRTETEREEDTLVPIGVESNKDRWDCETILSTYSNLENHPRLIRAREDKHIPKIYLDPRTGFPTSERIDARKQKHHITMRDVSEGSDEDEAIKAPPKYTITRPRNESREDKKSRKATVKAEKQVRRAAKKTLKEQFGVEIQAQKKGAEARTNARTHRL